MNYRKIRHRLPGLRVYPPHGRLIARSTNFHEIRQIGHARQLIQPWRRQILWLQYLRNAKLSLRHVHSSFTISNAHRFINGTPMGEQTGLTVVQQCRKVDATIPVCGQIVNSTFGQSRLEPGEH